MYLFIMPSHNHSEKALQLKLPFVTVSINRVVERLLCQMELFFSLCPPGKEVILQKWVFSHGHFKGVQIESVNASLLPLCALTSLRKAQKFGD